MSTSHTEREAEILSTVRTALETFRTCYTDGAFCTGYAWATLNGILVTLGDPPQTAPWRNDAKSDEPRAVQTQICPVCRTVHDLPLCPRPADFSENT